MLIQAERRGRITAAAMRTFLGLLESLPIRIEPASTASVWHDTLALARAHQLTAYDATYLELAMRLGLPLASRDQALQAAARSEGVPLLPTGVNQVAAIAEVLGRWSAREERTPSPRLRRENRIHTIQASLEPFVSYLLAAIADALADALRPQAPPNRFGDKFGDGFGDPVPEEGGAGLGAAQCSAQAVGQGDGRAARR